jgi:hypothetical protein
VAAICFQRRKVNLSQVFAGQKVGVKQTDEHIWLVTFMDYDLGYFDETVRGCSDARGIEAHLLLEHIPRGGPRRFRLKGEVHALMPAVLFGMARRNPFESDAEPKPPHGEFAQAIERVRLHPSARIPGQDPGTH